MTREDALRALYEMGAHLFAFHVERDSKDPVKKQYAFRKDWQTKRDPLAEVLAAAHIGMIPGSIGLSVPDPDVKDLPLAARESGRVERCGRVAEWAGATPYVQVTPSGGAHMFYKADKPRGKRTLEGVLDGVKLEVFGTTGFIELYDPVALVEHLDSLPVFEGEIPDDDPETQICVPARTNGRGRGHTEGDRNAGLFAKVRSAVENDPDPAPAVQRAIEAALAAGLGEREVAATVRSGARKGAQTRVEPEAPPEPSPEPEAAQEDAEAVLGAWQAESRPVPTPEPDALPAPTSFDRCHFEHPNDSYTLAHHWAGLSWGEWRCVLEGKGVQWHRFTPGQGWRPQPQTVIYNAIRRHGRQFFQAYIKTKEFEGWRGSARGGLVEQRGEARGGGGANALGGGAGAGGDGPGPLPHGPCRTARWWTPGPGRW